MAYDFFPESSNIVPTPTDAIQASDYYGPEVVDQEAVAAASLGNTLYGLEDLTTSANGSQKKTSDILKALSFHSGTIASNLPKNITQTAEFKHLVRRLANFRRRDLAVFNLVQPNEFRISTRPGFPLPDISGRKISTLLFPLPPERWQIQKSADSRTYVALNQEEFSLPGYASLGSVTLEGEFPYIRFTNAASRPAHVPLYINASNYFLPAQLVTWFTALMNDQIPFTLTIKHRRKLSFTKGGPPAFPPAQVFTVTDCTFGEVFGSPGDIAFQISLRQFRDFGGV